MPSNTERISVSKEKDLIEKTLDQIQERSLARPAGFNEKQGVNARRITDVDWGQNLWVMNAKYWVEYGRKGWRMVGVSYLAGYSDNQYWAVRVPSTLTGVKEALHWLTPALVKKALGRGQDVFRQGDIYFIPTNQREHDFEALSGTRHELRSVLGVTWPDRLNTGPVRIVHPQHPDVVLRAHPWEKPSWKAVQQKQLHIGNTRRGAD